MKQIQFIGLLLSLLVTAGGQAQEHRTIGAMCKYYVPSNNPNSVTPDGDAGCAVCQKERQEEYERESAAIREENRQREAKIAEENARWKQQKEAEQQAWEDRNTSALGKLASLERESEAYDRLRREENARKEEIRKRYDEQAERGNRDYNTYMAELQKMATASPSASTEAFWNETVSPANFLAFEGERDDWNNSFGFKDRNGNVRIPPRYSRATDFSGGIAFVGVRDREGEQYRLINSREETVVSFDAPFLSRISPQAGKTLVRWNFPDTISEGMVILELQGSDYQKNAKGALDKNGDLAVPPVFFEIQGFKNGISVASKFIDEEQYHFENFPRNYYGQFSFLEVGLIDKKGNWVEPPKKKMQYRYYSSSIGYLTIADKDEQLTEAEKRYQEEQWELTKKKRYAESMEKLEQEVQQRVSQAQAEGYLIENINPEDND